MEEFDGFLVFIVPITNYQSIIKGQYGRLASALLILKLLFVCFKIRSNYNVFHSHVFTFPFSALGVLGKLSGKMTIAKVTMSDELDLENIGRLAGMIHKLFAFSFDHIISISDEISNSLSKISIPSDKILYIPNSVNTSIFFPINPENKSKLKTKLQIPNGFVFISVGAITYRKGIDVLVQNWFAFNKRTPGTNLILLGPRSEEEGAIGDKYCYNEVLHFIDENDLSQNISMPGKVENVHCFLQCADIFVFTSRREGMPNVILEAMACGVPVISTPVSGIGNIITDGKNGEILDTSNNQLPIELMEKLYVDESLRTKYSKMGLSVISEKFSLDSIVSKYEQVYTNGFC